MNEQSNESEVRERNDSISREQDSLTDQRESPVDSATNTATETTIIDRGYNPFPEDIVPGTGGSTGGRGNDI
jgi:hypothetical protein